MNGNCAIPLIRREDISALQLQERSMTLTDAPIWKKRWETLAEILAELSLQYQKEAKKDPWVETIQSLVDCLHAFGKSQYKFFYDGFNGKKLLPSMDYPAEAVMRATIDQVAFDIDLFQTAVTQRQNKKARPTLELADKLAQIALDIAFQSKLLKEKCTAVTYFNKTPLVRVIPYAPVALIGVPMTSIQTPRDLLAIPHEVGHYVFFHAPGLFADLHQLTPIDPNWATHWIEEIFADTFGALIAGPVAGTSFQDLMFDNAYEDFVADNGHHPVDAIRPYGIDRALDLLGYDKAANALDTRWTSLLLQRHNPQTFIPHGECGEVSLSEAQTAVGHIIDTFVHYLTKERGVTQPDPWTQDTTDIDSLYKKFETWLTTKMPPTTVCTLKDLGANVGLVCGGGAPVSVRKKGSTLTWRDWFKEEASQRNDLIPWMAWMPVFVSMYWPVKGPENHNNGGGD